MVDGQIVNKAGWQNRGQMTTEFRIDECMEEALKLHSGLLDTFNIHYLQHVPDDTRAYGAQRWNVGDTRQHDKVTGLQQTEIRRPNDASQSM